MTDFIPAGGTGGAVLALAFGLVAALTAAPPARAQDEDALAREGAAIASAHCSRCHVVDDNRPFTGISSSPSFSLMVNALEDWEERFQSFHIRRPHPAIIRFHGEPEDPEYPPPNVPIVLDPADIDAIVAHARRLKKR